MKPPERKVRPKIHPVDVPKGRDIRRDVNGRTSVIRQAQPTATDPKKIVHDAQQPDPASAALPQDNLGHMERVFSGPQRGQRSRDRGTYDGKSSTPGLQFNSLALFQLRNPRRNIVAGHEKFYAWDNGENAYICARAGGGGEENDSGWEMQLIPKCN
ncbi:hypothetical protein BD779DRAFT_1479896 [Infundibulicybe gibba]|nr:hypothetical protein BD779DRAFT_1479896 [Infundibulicybe gibba]